MTSYIPLLAVQQRTHRIGYDMPVRAYSSGVEAAAASTAARNRLRAPMLLAAPKPSIVIPPEPEAVALPPDHNAPLNLLGPCHWRFLVAVAALRHGVKPEDIIGRSKPKALAAARSDAFYLAASHTAYSIARIGRLFGRDHTTILHSLKKHPPFVRPRLSPIEVAPAIPADPCSCPPERLRIITEGYAAGLSTKAIAERINMSPSTVKVTAMRHRLKHPSKPYFHRVSDRGDDEAAAR